MKITICLVLKLSVMISSFDPKKVDYCSLKCDKQVSSACKCTKANGFEEITDNMIGFRQMVVREHNKFRNDIAGGSLKDEGFPAAADMHVLNYDIELEHVARCFAINGYDLSADQKICHQVSFCKEGRPGQNDEINIEKKTDMHRWNKFQEKALKEWQTGRTLIPKNKSEDVINAYQTIEDAGRIISQFTRIVWATATRVGCFRAEEEDPGNEENLIIMVLICNYAGPDQNCSTNVLGERVYTPGPPCSICGNGTSCSTVKYPNLCGKLESIPTDLFARASGGCVLVIDLWILSIAVIHTVSVYVSEQK